jgi:hypothetical protein
LRALVGEAPVGIRALVVDPDERVVLVRFDFAGARSGRLRAEEWRREDGE